MKISSNPGITVSLVEDDTQVRKIIGGWIRNARGFQFLSEYSNAEDAVRHLPREKPEVVMMDINLPKMSGVECVRQVKPLVPDTQFVMLTVYQDAEHIFDALAAGASGYLIKQTPCEELLAALRDLRAGGSPMTSNIARLVVQSFQSAHPRVSAEHDISLRERQVVEYLAQGYLYKEIAGFLGISVFTVNAHIRRIYEKLHVRSRSQAVAKYMQLHQNPANAVS